jgi:hypothetical protein
MTAPQDGGGSASIITSAAFPALGAHYFGRAYFFVTALPSENVHVNYLTGRGQLPSGATADYSYGLGGTHLMANYFVFDPWQDWWRNSDTVLPVGEWICLEWEFDRDADTMHQWLNGAALTDQTVVGESPCCADKPWDAPTFAQQKIGWDYYQTTTIKNWDVFVDEVVLDDAPIGCLTD